MIFLTSNLLLVINTSWLLAQRTAADLGRSYRRVSVANTTHISPLPPIRTVSCWHATLGRDAEFCCCSTILPLDFHILAAVAQLVGVLAG